MRFNKLDLNLLVALDVLLEECNVSRAAERLGMTQSAASNSLARLREYFGDDILVQVGRKMEPTSRGLALKEQVHDILLRIETSVGMEPSFDPATDARSFRLMVSDYTMATLMPYVISRCARYLPNVRLELLPQADGVKRLLEVGGMDMLIIPDPYCAEEHPNEELLSETFVCLARRGNPLIQGVLDERTYLNATHAQVRTARGVDSFEAAALKRLGIERNIVLHSFSFAMMPHFIAASDCLATVHRRLAVQAASMLPLVVHELPFASPVMTQALQWHSYRSNDPGLIWLRTILHAAAADMDRGGSPSTGQST